MLNEKDLRGLQRILSHCERIVRYVPSSLSLAAFLADDEKQDAAVFNITQIGGLANAILSEECKNAMPTVEWNAHHSDEA